MSHTLTGVHLARPRVIQDKGRADVTDAWDAQGEQAVGTTFKRVRTMEPTQYQGAQPSIALLLKGSETPASEAIAHTHTMLYHACWLTV